MNTIKLDGLPSSLSSIVNTKSNEIKSKVLKELERAKDDCLSSIQVKAPRSTRNTNIHLADSFVAKKVSDGVNTRYIIYSKDKGPLVHLVEFGFTHYKTHKFVRGRQFMIPSLNEASKKLVSKVRKILV